MSKKEDNEMSCSSLVNASVTPSSWREEVSDRGRYSTVRIRSVFRWLHSDFWSRNMGNQLAECSPKKH